MQLIVIALCTPVQEVWMLFQALSRAEGGTKNELNSLEAEADMPLEQLLAQYGYVMGNDQDSDPVDGNAEKPVRQQKDKGTAEEGSTERPVKRRRTSNGDAHSSRPARTLSPAQPVAAQGSDSQHSGEPEPEPESGSDQSGDLRDLLDSPEAATAVDEKRAVTSRPRPALSRRADRDLAGQTASALPKQELNELGSDHSESDFDSAAGSDAGVDDEQTLEEEERMANAEGAAHHVSASFDFGLHNQKVLCCAPHNECLLVSG